jgi:DNA-binding transcriptional LysR family regulator
VLSAELKAFYMVARLGSITLAAKKLGLSQPTVTTQIRLLESQYSSTVAAAASASVTKARGCCRGAGKPAMGPELTPQIAGL